jgi:hypothetical protein
MTAIALRENKQVLGQATMWFAAPCQLASGNGGHPSTPSFYRSGLESSLDNRNSFFSTGNQKSFGVLAL